jgi:hypothetical protein
MTAAWRIVKSLRRDRRLDGLAAALLGFTTP